MRLAKVSKYWEKALGADRGFRLTRLVVAGKPPVTNTDVLMANGITVVCGLNGVGKTTTLRLLHRSLVGLTAPPLRPQLIEEGEFEVHAKLDGVDLRADLSDEEVLNAALIDGFDACQRIRSIGRQSHVEDLIEAAGDREFTPEELAQAAYVVGKPYARIVVSEIEETTDSTHVDADDEVAMLPYFRVTANGHEYDALAMGLGELGALAALWSMWRAEANTVLLIEEPETFLSAHASAALMDVVARTVADRRLCAVVTTHSPAVLNRVPEEHVLVLSQIADGYRLERPHSRGHLEYLLGSPIGQGRILLTEDLTAAVFTTELLARRSTLWTQSIEILQCGGEEPVRDICRKFSKSRRVSLVGVLDGDQELGTGYLWPIVLLPGPDNPDLQLRRAAETESQEFAERLGRPANVVAAALEPLSGVDEHDWFQHVADAVGIQRGEIVRASVSCWLKAPENQAAADSFGNDVVEALSR